MASLDLLHEQPGSGHSDNDPCQISVRRYQGVIIQ